MIVNLGPHIRLVNFFGLRSLFNVKIILMKVFSCKVH